MFKPLKGIKVLDLTGVLAGPYCTYQLALLGADVIKMENLQNGDWTRVGGKDQSLVKKSMGTSFLIQNSDKKSIQINLKSKKGKNIALELIKNVDIFVENMRPGKAEKLGLGWKDLSKINSKIIYCSISAFGQDGPFKNRGAYDHVVQGMIDNARVVNGGMLTLQGIANGSIIIENGGTLNLLGVVNGKIENNGGKLFISGMSNLVVANSGYTEISGIVNTLKGNGEIIIKPGSIISGKNY